MLAANNWNVVQYSVLVHMFAQVSGLVPGELVHMISDAHIYDRHIPLIEDLIQRPQFPAPTFQLDPDVTDFYDFTPDNIMLRRKRGRTRTLCEHQPPLRLRNVFIRDVELEDGGLSRGD